MVARVLPSIVLAGILLLVAVSGMPTDEPCRQDVAVKQNFNLADYTGTWYEIKRYKANFKRDLDCVVAEYAPTGDNTVSVKNGGFILATNETMVMTSTAAFSFPDAPQLEGKLSIGFSGAKPTRSNYWVLDTDYTSYSVVWSCLPSFKDPTKMFRGFWVLSRTPTFTTNKSVVDRVNELVKEYSDPSKVVDTIQSDERCPRSY